MDEVIVMVDEVIIVVGGRYDGRLVSGGYNKTIMEVERDDDGNVPKTKDLLYCLILKIVSV